MTDPNTSALSGKSRVPKHGKDCATGHAHRTPTGTRRKRRNGAAARAHVGLKPMRFNSLHHHTTYSYLDGFQLPEAHIRRATEINMQSMAFTEHGNVSSHVKAEIAAQAAGVKAIYGCEVYAGGITDDTKTQKKNHLTVLAENDEGYRNLMRLVTLSFAEGFFHEPTVDSRLLKEHKAGLIILSGCLGSQLATACIGGKHVEEKDASYARGLRVARWFKKTFGANYYLEVQAFPELEKTRRLNPMIMRIGRVLGIPVVATKDCHYTIPEETEVQKILHNVRPGNRQTLEDMERDWGYDVPLCPPTTDRQIMNELIATGLTKKEAVEAIINTEVVAQRCNVTLPKLPMLRYPLQNGQNEVELWREELRKGWFYRGCGKWPPAKRAAARKQMQKEIRLIESKDFTSYFLVVGDSVRFAKDYRGIDFPYGIPVGPARGSAAASFCCWLLRITEVNPLLFPNLVFERFIDESRADLPDIDLDFASEGRKVVREYLVSKYGSECVNNIGTFTYYKSKLALDDVAKVHRIPKFEVEKVKELLIERSSGDLRANATIEDTVEQFDAARDVVERYPALRKAMQLEGNSKQFGVHAAGLVVSNGPITDVCAVYEREVKDQIIQVISMDKYDAERQGLIKMDYLGLSTMSAIAKALSIMKMPLEDLYKIPLDLQNVLQGFRDNDVVGIFQYDGRAMRMVCAQLQPDNFDEVCDTNALARPGPLHSGAAEEYIQIKHGRKQAIRLHPALDRITKNTHYQIVYQEQILRIVREIGGFGWTDAAYIRKIISKKLGEAEFNRQIEKYLSGVATVHERFDGDPVMTEEIGRKIWNGCTTAGSYAFNAAHCVSYGMLGYWTMWLKRTHPAVFYAAFLAEMPDTKHHELRRDAARHNVEIRPPHPRHSKGTWTTAWPPPRRQKQPWIRAGFEQIKGIGEKMAPIMAEARDEYEFNTWKDFQKLKGIGPKTIDKIEEFVAAEDPFGIFAVDRRIESVRADLEGMDLPEPTHSSLEIPFESKHDEQIVWMGVVTDRNLRDIFESNRARTGEELDPKDVKRPELNEFVIMRATDGEEMTMIRFNRFIYPKFRDAIWGIKLKEDVVLVQGVKPKWRTAREIYVSKMYVLSPDED